MKKYSSDKDINKLVIVLLKNYGWKVKDKSRRKHSILISPLGHKQAIPCTPSDHRAFVKFKCDIKRIRKKLNNLKKGVNYGK